MTNPINPQQTWFTNATAASWNDFEGSVQAVPSQPFPPGVVPVEPAPAPEGAWVQKPGSFYFSDHPPLANLF
jgi:hypothetical protein